MTVPVVLVADAVTSPAAALPGLPVLLVLTGTVLAATAAALAVRLPTAVAAVAGQLSGHGALLALTGGSGGGDCLPTVGRGAGLGLRLALLRTDPTCPPGTLAAGPTTSAALGTVLAALLVLAFHALAASAGTVMLAAARTAVRAVAALRALVPRLPVASVSLPRPRLAGAPAPPSWTPRVAVPGTLGRRGPPEALVPRPTTR